MRKYTELMKNRRIFMKCVSILFNHLTVLIYLKRTLTDDKNEICQYFDRDFWAFSYEQT